MNEELIRQAVADTVHCENYPSDGGFRTGQEDAAEAIRLYHARAVAPLVEAAEEYMAADGEVDATVCNPLFAKRSDLDARDAAVERKRRAFGQLRTALAPFQQKGDAPTPQHSPDVARLVEALRAVTPITVHNTPDYAELTFGGSQTQAMTMEPQKWEAVNAALAPFQQEAK